MKTIRKLLFILIASVMIISGMSIYEEESAQAGVQTFTFPNEIKPTPCNLINGGFETPVINAWNKWINESEVPGWETTPVRYINELYQQLGYNIIEFWSDDYGQFMGSPAQMPEGNQCAELQAQEMMMRMYQDVSTTPGVRVLYSFLHKARVYYGAQSTTYDVANFYIRPSGTPTDTPTSAQLIETARDNGSTWGTYKGEYIVPAGQTSTEISLHTVSWGDGWIGRGNLVDDVHFQTGAYLITKKSIETSAVNNDTALKGEIVTVTVEITNWGETDASYCLFRDVISDGLEYIEGSSQIDGVDAGDLVTYNPETEVLNIRFGETATSTSGGLLRGSIYSGTQSTGEGETITITFQARVTEDAGYIVKNQAFVRYNDYGWSSVGSGPFYSYSSVAGETPVSSDETTYVNQFAIIDRAINGRAWYDADNDGMIDAGELMVSGVTVSLYSITDTTYTTPVNDVSGNPLTTTTDANGAYEFTAIPAGNYKVVAATPDGYKVTLKTVSTDNDATAESSNAVSDGIDLDEVLSVTNTQQIVDDVDFGFSDLTGISKTAQVNGGAEDTGTAAAPIDVTGGDYITYTINVESDEIITGATITDEIPEGLTLITTTGTYTSGMTWATDGSGITTVTWEDQTLAAGTNSFQFQVRVTAISTSGASMIYENTAELTSALVNSQSNTTYHAYTMASIMISKLVKGNLADVNEEFTFTVNLAGVTGTLNYVGDSMISGVAAPADGTITDGGTVTLKHGQVITIEDVPLGTVYSITENSGTYTQTVTTGNSSGTLIVGTYIEFVNTKNYVPPTGVTMDTIPQLIAVISIIGLFVTLYLTKRNKNNKNVKLFNKVTICVDDRK